MTGREQRVNSKPLRPCFGQHHPREKSFTLIKRSSNIAASPSKISKTSVGRALFTQMTLRTPRRHSFMQFKLEKRTAQHIVYDAETGNIAGITQAARPCVILMAGLFSGTGFLLTSMSENAQRTIFATHVTNSRKLRG